MDEEKCRDCPYFDPESERCTFVWGGFYRKDDAGIWRNILSNEPLTVPEGSPVPRCF